MLFRRTSTCASPRLCISRIGRPITSASASGPRPPTISAPHCAGCPGRAHSGRGARGAPPPAAIGEGVHFSLHKVALLAGRAGEDLGVLDHGRAELPEAEALGERPDALLQRLPASDLLRGLR